MKLTNRRRRLTMYKVEVLVPFFDDNGLHEKGTVATVKFFYPDSMRLIEEDKAEKPTPKKKGK
jgi:hypothetical protein